MSFIGYVELEDPLTSAILFRDAARTPVDTDVTPTFRVYGPEGLVVDATGVASSLDTGVVTAASNETPIVISSANHRLSDGTLITVAGVLGNTGANGTFLVTVVDADTFELDGSVGNGVYTSGGGWNVTGLYRYSILCTSAAGFESGTSYMVFLQGEVAGVPTADTQVFIVT